MIIESYFILCIWLFAVSESLDGLQHPSVFDQ